MKTMRLSFILLSVFFTILLIGIASAEVTQINKVYQATIADNGSVITTTTPVTNFNVIGFVCSTNDCSNVNGTLWNGDVLNSGSNSQITLTYPTELKDKGYGLFFYKEGYIPYEVKNDLRGTGQASDEKRYLAKAANCEVPVNHLIISHVGNKITVNVTLDAGVSSPLKHAGPLNYVPNALAQYYSVDSRVDFRFIGPQNVSISKDVALPFSQSKEVFATTTLAAGQYTIEVESNTIDSKCIHSVANKLTTNVRIEDNRTNATLPLIAILSPEARTYTNRSILVNLRAINATSVFYNWNGTNVSYSAPVTVQFNEGLNTLTAYAVNSVTTAHVAVTFNVNTTAGNQTNPNNTTNDTIAPASVSNLHVITKDSDSIQWGWNNPSDSDFAAAIIYINGMNVANTSSTTYTASGLADDTLYTITINTKDFTGNVNRNNVSLTTRTNADNNNDDDNDNDNGGKKKKLTVRDPLVADKISLAPFIEDEIIEVNALEKQKSRFLPILLIILFIAILVLLILILLAGLRQL